MPTVPWLTYILLENHRCCVLETPAGIKWPTVCLAAGRGQRCLVEVKGPASYVATWAVSTEGGQQQPKGFRYCFSTTVLMLPCNCK